MLLPQPQPPPTHPNNTKAPSRRLILKTLAFLVLAAGTSVGGLLLLIDSINRGFISHPVPDVLKPSALSEAGIFSRQLYHTCTTHLRLLLDTFITSPIHKALSSLGDLLLEIQLWLLRVDGEHAEGVWALTASMLHYVERGPGEGGGKEGGGGGRHLDMAAELLTTTQVHYMRHAPDWLHELLHLGLKVVCAFVAVAALRWGHREHEEDEEAEGAEEEAEQSNDAAAIDAISSPLPSSPLCPIFPTSTSATTCLSTEAPLPPPSHPSHSSLRPPHHHLHNTRRLCEKFTTAFLLTFGFALGVGILAMDIAQRDTEQDFLSSPLTVDVLEGKEVGREGESSSASSFLSFFKVQEGRNIESLSFSSFYRVEEGREGGREEGYSLTSYRKVATRGEGEREGGLPESQLPPAEKGWVSSLSAWRRTTPRAVAMTVNESDKEGERDEGKDGGKEEEMRFEEEEEEVTDDEGGEQIFNDKDDLWPRVCEEDEGWRETWEEGQWVEDEDEDKEDKEEEDDDEEEDEEEEEEEEEEDKEKEEEQEDKEKEEEEELPLQSEVDEEDQGRKGGALHYHRQDLLRPQEGDGQRPPLALPPSLPPSLLPDAQGWSVIHHAAWQGKTSLLFSLLSSTSPFAFLQRGPGGVTPLMLAAKGGHVEAVKLLVGIEEVRRVGRARDEKGRHALLDAWEGRNEGVVLPLLQCFGEEVGGREGEAEAPSAAFLPLPTLNDLHWQTGRSLLHEAVKEEWKKVIKALLVMASAPEGKGGTVDVNVRSGGWGVGWGRGRTPMQLAVWRQDEEIGRMLWAREEVREEHRWDWMVRGWVWWRGVGGKGGREEGRERD